MTDQEMEEKTELFQFRLRDLMNECRNVTNGKDDGFLAYKIDDVLVMYWCALSPEFAMKKAQKRAAGG